MPHDRWLLLHCCISPCTFGQLAQRLRGLSAPGCLALRHVLEGCQMLNKLAQLAES